MAMATNPTVSSTIPTTADFARLIISLVENRSRNSANPTSAPSPSKKLKTQTNCPNGFPAASSKGVPSVITSVAAPNFLMPKAASIPQKRKKPPKTAVAIGPKIASVMNLT